VTTPGPDALLSMYGRSRAGPSVPIPFSPPLEAFATPKAEDVAAAVRRVLK
jgi:hypothetical protein